MAAVAVQDRLARPQRAHTVFNDVQLLLPTSGGPPMTADRMERVKERARGMEHAGYYVAETDLIVKGADTFRTLSGAEWKAMREKCAEDMALTDNEDGCFEDVRGWENLEQWEREAQPDECPHWEYENCEYWRRRADAAMTAMGFERTPDDH